MKGIFVFLKILSNYGGSKVSGRKDLARENERERNMQ